LCSTGLQAVVLNHFTHSFPDFSTSIIQRYLCPVLISDNTRLPTAFCWLCDGGAEMCEVNPSVCVSAVKFKGLIGPS
jgi:hypothetical protein